MKPTKREVAAGLRHWEELYSPPESKKPQAPGGEREAEGSDSDKTCCNQNATTSDHACASSFPHPDLDDSYDAEVKRRDLVKSFRQVGAALLPLFVLETPAHDFGKSYALLTAQGEQLYTCPEFFPIALMRDALTEVIKGGV